MPLSTLKTSLFNFVRHQLFVDTPLESTLRKFVAGQSSESWRARFIPSHTLFRSPSRRVLRDQTRSLEFDLSDWMEWAAYFELSDPSIEQLISLLKPGDIALDVGSNIGSMLIAMAKTVGPTGFVYGFEPQTSRYQKCADRLRYSQVQNASVERLAVGAARVQVEIVSPDPRNAGRARVRGKSDDSAPVDQVTCVPLDFWLEDKKIEKVSLIKIDVEGFEMEVLKGMTTLLERYSPVLFIEVDNGNLGLQGSSANELLQWLRDRRYGFDESQIHHDHYDLVARRD